jgi:phage I-like protein
MDIKILNAKISNGALLKDTLPKTMKILDWGKNDTTTGPVYLTDETVKTFTKWQKQNGRDKDVPVDFDHCTVPESEEYVAGKVKDIAAYADPVLKPGDGLYLTNLEWTPLGKEKAKNYKDLSPAVKVTDAGVVVGLHSCALTPTGAIFGLTFYSATNKNDTDMIKKYSKDYNKDGANAGLKYSGEGEVGEKNVITHPTSADDASKQRDEEALKETKEIEKHEEDEIKDESADEGNSTYLGADDNWNEDELGNHQDKVKDFEADDHESEYGDVDYADKKNHKYPINNEEHIRAAWSYINMPKNEKEYDSEELSTIKGHIKAAAEKHGIDIAENDKEKETKTKTMNALVQVDAWKGALPLTMNNEILKKMAAEVGMEDESDTQRVLEAFLAKYLGAMAEIKGQLTTKENTNEGGLKQFSAVLTELKNEIKALKADKAVQLKQQEEFERNTLIKEANKDGKILSLSANSLKTVDINILREMVSNAPKGMVQFTSKTRLFNANPTQKLSMDEQKEIAKSRFEENIKQQLGK